MKSWLFYLNWCFKWIVFIWTKSVREENWSNSKMRTQMIEWVSAFSLAYFATVKQSIFVVFFCLFFLLSNSPRLFFTHYISRRHRKGIIHFHTVRFDTPFVFFFSFTFILLFKVFFVFLRYFLAVVCCVNVLLVACNFWLAWYFSPF